MGIGLSLYLDLVRFGMAAEVALGHMAAGFMGRHAVLWFLPPFMQTAVTGFFVLSGFVIAYVVDRTEHRGWDYASARIARLYSVILPALALTYLLDTAGSAVDRDYYANPIIGHLFDGDVLERYAANLFNIGSAWIIGLPSPGTNGAFWTMSFEATYYALFGFLIFCRGPRRIIAALAIALIAGPKILALFPIWLGGAAAYYAAKRYRPPKWAAALLFLASIILLEKVGWIRNSNWGHAL